MAGSDHDRDCGTGTPSAVRFDRVGFAWPGSAPVLQDVSLLAAGGEITAIIGPSGCGKSTLLRIAAGLVEPTVGRVECDRSSMAFVFQDPTLLPWRTLWQNVALPLELRGRPGRGEAEGCLERVGLAGLSERLPHALSGGQRMRASLARALVTEPRLMLLDEPFGALDALTRSRLQESFLGLWEDRPFTALLVTHDIDEAVYLSDRVVVLGGSPGSLRDVVEVDLPRPRRREMRHDAQAGLLADRIEAAL